MRVSVYKGDLGALSVLVEPSPGRGRVPVLLQGITEKTVVQAVGPVVRDMRGERVKASGGGRAGPALDGAGTV